MPKKSFINDTLNYLKQSYGQDTLKKTMYYQQKYGFDVNQDPSKRTHNNEGDAFKHAFMSADLMINPKYPFTAEQIANIHEWQGNNFYGQPAGEDWIIKFPSSQDPKNIGIKENKAKDIAFDIKDKCLSLVD